MEGNTEEEYTPGERDELNKDIDLIYKTLTQEDDGGSSVDGDEDENGENVNHAPTIEKENLVDNVDCPKSEPEDEDSEQENPKDSVSIPQSNNESMENDTADLGAEASGSTTDVTKIQEAANLLMNIGDGEVSASAETCLMLNRAYQEALTETLSSIEVILAHSRDRQKALEEEIESGMSQKAGSASRDRLISSYGVPYFKDSRGRVPPPNEDHIAKNLEFDPYEKGCRMWTEAHQKTLMKAVAADGLKKLMQPLMNRKNLAIEKLEAATTTEEKDEIRIRLSELDAEITRARYARKEDLHGEWTDEEAIDKIDWMKISAFDFDGLFSDSYLRLKWKNHLHPDINKGPWTLEEDELLTCYAEAHHFRCWDRTALLLSTNRSAFQCLQRYQTKLAPSLAMGPWAPEEDEALKNVVETFTFDNYIAWHQVACYMEGRTREQCKSRWDSWGARYKKGRWTTEEDVRVLSAVHCYGQSWRKVQQFLPNRTLSQIRERWINSLAQEIKYGNWTYEDDRQLILSVDKYGERWAAIAREMPGRTDNMLLQRFRRLMQWKRDNQELGAMPKGLLERYQEQRDARGTSAKQTEAASMKIGRLLQQKRAQEEFLERERTSDLILKVESGEGGKTTPDPPETTGEDPGYIEEIGEEKPGTSQNNEGTEPNDDKGVINLVARRTYRERTKNWAREVKLIEADLEQGIYVPRPPDTNATRIMSYLNKRKSLHEAIMNYVRNTLKTTSKGDPQVIYEKLKDSLQSRNMSIEEEVLEEPITYDEPSPTVLNLLQRAEGIKKMKQRMEIRTKADILSHDSSKSIEIQIMKILREKNSMKRKPGRPRKFHAVGEPVSVVEDADNAPEEQKPGRLEEVEQKISRLMLNTMNIDKSGASVMAHAIVSKSDEKPHIVAPEASTSKRDPSAEGADSSGECVEPSAPVLEQNEIDYLNHKGKMRKKHFKGSFVYVHGLDEYDNGMVLRAPADKRAKEDVDYLQGVLELENPDQIPRVYRRNMVGQAEKLYHIPPIPPNSTTLRAFKTLMLNRRLLVKNAQNYHKPGPLDGKKAAATSSQPCSSAGKNDATLQNAVAKADQSIPSRVLQGLDSELHLSDFTPLVLKKLKQKFSEEEIKSAQHILRQRQDIKKENPGSATVVSPPAGEEKAPDSRTRSRWNVLRRAKLSHDYHLLKSRFLSLFLWPAMMSSFELPDPNKKSKSPNACSPRKKRRLPMTASKRARKEHIKSKSKKMLYQQAMSEVRKASIKNPKPKPIPLDVKPTLPIRQSRRLKTKRVDYAESSADLLLSCTSADTCGEGQEPLAVANEVDSVIPRSEAETELISAAAQYLEQSQKRKDPGYPSDYSDSTKRRKSDY